MFFNQKKNIFYFPQKSNFLNEKKFVSCYLYQHSPRIKDMSTKNGFQSKKKILILTLKKQFFETNKNFHLLKRTNFLPKEKHLIVTRINQSFQTKIVSYNYQKIFFPKKRISCLENCFLIFA